MKKLLVLLSVGVLALGIVGCGNAAGQEDDRNQSQNQETDQPENTPTPIPTQSPEVSDTETGAGANDHDYSQGWTEEMNAIKTAITDELGDNYFPNMPLDPDLMEDLLGITYDMYDDYFAEIPMISTNVDTLVVVKAREDQADAVEELLNAYRDKNVGNTMQYPQNVGKIQASKVVRIDNYVIYVQLGGDIMDIMDDGDEAVIVRCQEENDKVIEIIKEAVR